MNHFRPMRMLTRTERLRRCLAELDAAASPEAYAYVCARIVDLLADEAEAAGNTCDDNWQDSDAGKPWRAIARYLNGTAGGLAELSKGERPPGRLQHRTP